MRTRSITCVAAVLLLASCDAQFTRFESTPDELTADRIDILHKTSPDDDVGFRCGTVLPDPAVRVALDRAAVAGKSFRSRPVEIPVVYHVVAYGSSIEEGNVPEDWIAAQHAVLNHAFGDTPFDFGDDYTVNRTIDRRLARCSSRGSESALLGERVGGPETLNIYICDTGQYLGWAYFPGSAQDGVFVWSFSLPNGEYGDPYNEGDTATHEVGHWLGLYHTFQASGTGRPQNRTGCAPPGDHVDDTPAEASAAFGCPVGRDTCPDDPGLDPIINFMDYTDDACMVEFTPGQGDRMTGAWDAFRAPAT
jgi:hypothetical protein